MQKSTLNNSRLIVGLILIAVAAALFLFAEQGVYTTGAIGLGVLGVVSIAISRRG
jgi:hypothetical protein